MKSFSVFNKDIKDINVFILILLFVLIIGISGLSSYAIFSSSSDSSDVLSGVVVSSKGVSGAEAIIKKVGTDGLVAESHPATEQMGATTDYRYTGANPNNYVKFNNELWRIIGVFDVDDGDGNIEQRVKLIRNDSIDNVVLNSDWSTSPGMILLNSGDYWNRTGSYVSTGLTDEAKSMIGIAKWYFAGANSYDTITAYQIYTSERSSRSSGLDDIIEPESWLGKVALMYASDYGYATTGGRWGRDGCITNRAMYEWTTYSDCKDNDWLLDSSNGQYTMTPYVDINDDGRGYYYVSGKGDVVGSQPSRYGDSVRPCVFLKSVVRLTGGKGTESNPYTISMPKIEVKNAAKTIIDKAVSDELVVDSHPGIGTEQADATIGYRYIGANPNNYVDFNNELWRIIGVFDVDDGTGKLEKRIKLIRNDILSNIAWDSGRANYWPNASLMTILNSGDYWNRTGSYSSTGLTEEARLMIGDAKWYLGGTNYSSSTTITATQFYSYERGTTVYGSYIMSWIGKVALMYPSDYGYATSGGSTTNRNYCLARSMQDWDGVSYCIRNDWLYNSNSAQWTLTHNSIDYNSVFGVYRDGSVGGSFGVNESPGVRPSVYLSSDVSITGGTGTQSDPYQLTITKPDPPKSAKDFANWVGYGGLVKDSHPATDQLPATTAYRYTGVNPDNYINFNNELWRIIGIFDVDDGTGKIEKRIKIIRKDILGNLEWDYKSDDTYVNDWSKATGMTLLNSGDYWNRTGSYASTGLTEEAKGQIADAKWYLGGTNQSDTTATQFYSYERGSTVYGSNPTSWVGKVGIMYPSDYGYATSGGFAIKRKACLAKELYGWDDSSYSYCKNNDWLYNSSAHQWLLTPHSGNSECVFGVDSTGFAGEYGVYDSGGFRPSVYLKSDISISGGTGTQSNPYQLS